MAGSTKQVANSGLDRRSDGDAKEAERAAVLTVRLLAVVFALGVTLAGLNMQPPAAGKPEHERLIELENEPFGTTVTVKSAEFPADSDAAAGLEDRVKSAGLTVWLNVAEVLAALIASPL
jgi:hypothetical protein